MRAEPRTRPPPLPQDVLAGQRLSAQTINDMLAALRALAPVEMGRLTYRGTPFDRVSFGFQWLGPKTIRLYPGGIDIIGKGYYELAQSDVALTGSVSFVYLHLLKGSTTPTAQTAASRPTSTGSDIKIGLYRFAYIFGSDMYELTDDLRHDIRLGGVLTNP